MNPDKYWPCIHIKFMPVHQYDPWQYRGNYIPDSWSRCPECEAIRPGYIPVCEHVVLGFSTDSNIDSVFLDYQDGGRKICYWQSSRKWKFCPLCAKEIKWERNKSK